MATRELDRATAKEVMYARTGVVTPMRETRDGVKIALRCLRDGSLSVADFAMVSTLEGVVQCASVGAESPPATFKTGLTAARPELVIDVPVNTTIIPLSLQVHLETSAGTDNEIVAQTSTANVGAGTSTPVTVRNVNSGSDTATACSVYSLYSGDGTAPLTPVEFWRAGYAFADTTLGPLKAFNWSWRRFAPVVIVGPGAMVVYVGATTTAPAGFIKASWIELPSSLIVPPQ